MRIVLLGPPAAGKGTQAQSLCEKYNIIHISTGDILRYHIQSNTEYGIKASKYVNRGLLVPDELVVELLEEQIQHEDCKNRFLLDGFPRNLYQAQMLDDFLNKKDLQLDAVINIEIPDDEIIHRISGRRICSNCKAIFNVNNEIVENCRNCNSKLILRHDDEETVVKERLKVYNNETKLLNDFYKGKGILLEIDGLGSIDEVAEKIRVALGSMRL